MAKFERNAYTFEITRAKAIERFKGHNKEVQARIFEELLTYDDYYDRDGYYDSANACEQAEEPKAYVKEISSFHGLVISARLDKIEEVIFDENGDYYDSEPVYVVWDEARISRLIDDLNSILNNEEVQL